MATRVTTEVNYDVIYGYTLRVNGLVRKNARQVTREATAVAKIRVVSNSQAAMRNRGRYPRTGHLARTITDKHEWANQFGTGRSLRATAKYARFVHDGTHGPIRGKQNRGPGGQFAAGRGRLPVGKSQGGRDIRLMRQVPGQTANPFLEDALRITLVRFGFI